MIPRKAVWALGLAQLISWGISFYYIGVFGDLIAPDLGWSRALVFGGFSAALITMGAASSFVGKAIDSVGGRPVLMAGAMLCAASLSLLAMSNGVTLYYAAWIGLGIAMRCTLYDAAFAALVKIEGSSARRSITQITLLGGLAATFFWPLGHFLAETFGWRWATLIYAGFAPILLLIFATYPDAKDTPTFEPSEPDRKDAPQPRGNPARSAMLCATIIALGNGLHAGMSAHLITVLTDLGLAAGLAVSVAALRGVGQTSGRIAELAFGQKVHPIHLSTFAAALIVASFALGFLVAGLYLTAAAFVFLYGVATGLLTITRGTLPLVLFDPRRYGAMVGILLVPSFLVSAASPVIFAYVLDVFGPYTTLGFGLTVGVLMVLASLALPSK
ncbi:MAG: MFS transporter [Rhodobacteraceae bacterium]|nr:MFS transporter [Paracoccaceae bacterium]